MNDRGSRPGIGRMAGGLAGSGWPAVIVLAGLLAYSNTFNSPFLFDDLPGIVDNPAVSAETTAGASRSRTSFFRSSRTLL